jgi:mannitol/fructose-specific phosphotransferase system IIA component (Ntr-type)
VTHEIAMKVMLAQMGIPATEHQAKGLCELIKMLAAEEFTESLREMLSDEKLMADVRQAIEAELLKGAE